MERSSMSKIPRDSQARGEESRKQKASTLTDHRNQNISIDISWLTIKVQHILRLKISFGSSRFSHKV